MFKSIQFKVSELQCAALTLEIQHQECVLGIIIININ